MKLLFVASNPKSESELLLDAEVDELRAAVGRFNPQDISADFRMQLAHHAWPVLLNEFAPDCLHISAHGAADSIVIADMSGREVNLGPDVLAEYLKRRPPRLVFLNACDSAPIAKDLTKYVDMAVGCTTPIKNYMARQGASIFYQLLLSGESVGDAFRVSAAHLAAASHGEYRMELHQRAGINPALERLNPPIELIARATSPKDADGYQEFVLGVIGCRPGVRHAVFYSDDPEVLAHYGPDEGPFSVVRGEPADGTIWTRKPWNLNNDPILHCACSGNGRAMIASAKLSEALALYKEMLN